MLGSISGKRRCAWFSGCNSLCAALLRCNTNIMPNFRVPLTKTTTECAGACLPKASAEEVQEQMKKLCIIAQRAMKQMTGYFSGYISKKQKLGKFELKAASSALPFLLTKLQKLHTASAQLALVTNRLITTLEGKGILRSAPEAFNLCGKSLPKDELNAEFVRTFRTVNFCGSEYLQRLELVITKTTAKDTIAVRIPVPKSGKKQPARPLQKDVDVYGYRGSDRRVYYLSPWEFLTYWFAEPLQPPSKDYTCTAPPTMTDYFTEAPRSHSHIQRRLCETPCIVCLFLGPGPGFAHMCPPLHRSVTVQCPGPISTAS
jgi:hypothetical protein